MFQPLGRARRKRKEAPVRLCMACGQSTGTCWKWLCNLCFGALPFARRKMIAEAGQAREPARVFGLCRDAAGWLQEQRQRGVE